MNKIKNLLSVSLGKLAALALLSAVVFAAATPALAQTADVRYAGVFYQDNPSTVNGMYCDYAIETFGTAGNKSNVQFLNDIVQFNFTGNTFGEGSPVTIRYQFDHNTTTAPTSISERQTNTAYSLGDQFYLLYNGNYLVFSVTQAGTTSDNTNAQMLFLMATLFGSFTYPSTPITDGSLTVSYSTSGSGSERIPGAPYGVGDTYWVEDSAGIRRYFTVTNATQTSSGINIAAGTVDNRSFTHGISPSSSQNGTDPWVSSALIEYDQPYPSAVPSQNEYPNHCLALCMNVVCTNKPMSQSTYSIAFPLQNIKFDIVKYYNNKNVENPEETPAVRTIDLYPDLEEAKCGSYACGGAVAGNPCTSAEYVCDRNICNYWCTGSGCEESDFKNMCHKRTESGGYQWNDSAQCCRISDSTDCDVPSNVCGNYGENCMIFNNDGTPTNQAIPFCAAWDGSYDIAGEFGKTNGTFAFRATVATDVPGDNIITDKIQFNSTIAYPGMNQIPIRVDVTNIHTVRSTPSLVGNITAVSAQPYTYAYRLSKDSDVRIAVMDASTDDDVQYGATSSQTGDPAYIWDVASRDIVRTLVDWQPRLGEGMKGIDPDVQITEFDSWDGRNDDGLFLPAGNYVVALQAKSQDEWPGIDFSRAVTRQLSLDPLKLTDVVATGLTKQSTAYASIAYTPTESSKVYWYIYTPGTTFGNDVSTPNAVLTNSAAPTGTEPSVTGATGSPVFVLTEDRVGRMNFTSKWNGLCGMDGTVPFHLAQNQAYPTGAVDNLPGQNPQPLTGTCTNADGCTYYMPQCVRTYAEHEKMSDGGYCGDTLHPFVSGNICQETFEYGAPLPDGNYVYALWAEIPYNGCYYNKSSSWTDGTNTAPYFDAGNACGANGTLPNGALNGQAFSGVKTLKYDIGQVAIERGVVDITMQPVSYSTVGSSPTAFGLDPFIFKYSIARDATVVAKVTNSAGTVTVKYLTPETGITQVAQQMNTLSWDGRDDAGRMVYPGTYMFVVEAKDAMFPAVTNRASVVFPVDMYRLVDLSTTDVYGDSNAKATLSYTLSKAMNVQVNIYNKDIVIPNYNSATGDYNDITITSSATGMGYADALPASLTFTLSDGSTYTGTSATEGTETIYATTYRDTITTRYNPSYDGTSTTCDPTDPMTCQYRISVLREYFTTSATSVAAWPPRLCDQTTDAANFVGGYVDPATRPQCIYVNDTAFTNYPADAAEAASGVVDVRLQPVHTIERTALKPGDGLQLMEEWDALYFYNPLKCPANSTNLKNCLYEMVPDGSYPFFVSARSNEPFDRYYYNEATDGPMTDPATGTNYVDGAPFRTMADTKQESYLYATDKAVSKLNITRGPVYFLDGSTVVYPNAPQLFNVSSGPVFIPPYEINFSVSRAATVEVAIVALQPGVCNPDPTVHQDLKNNIAGDICKFISTMTIANTGHFDPTIVRKAYWDGTDNNGYYVKPGIYEVRLTAKNYPDPGLYQTTVKSITVNADLLKVFDLLEADGYAIAQRGTDMKISYQLSVPMKVGIQIFKPGTTIYDYQKGTLRNPTTGSEVKDIREVLVKAITGIRPGTTLIEEVWDGTDYAGQEVPDGTYPFRFVTALNSADIDSVTGEIIGDWAQTDGDPNPANWKVNRVADTYEYQNLHKATIAIGDGRFVCEDWEKTVFFYPNPFNTTNGTLEITKMPVPGEMSIKYYNLAGDLVRDSEYTCVDANNYQVTMGSSLTFNPDNTPDGSTQMSEADLLAFPNVRNAAMRCRWDKNNQHKKKVARGVYFALVDFKAKMGREHCQKVVKILIP
ncbi:MAG: hypothetical protein IKP06_03015 [Elusimicrobiaceae bacterium]|nr:hypothetical protein [Elusimicrobiaceae bacterium]